MPPATNTSRQLHEARQLQHLRQLRERKAWQALCAAQAEQHAAEQKLRSCEADLEQLQAERQQLSQRIVGEYLTHIGRFSDNLHALQIRMDDQLERADDAVVEAHEMLRETQQASAAAHAHWLRAAAQNSAADTLVADMHTSHQQQREARLEREEEAPMPRPFFSTTSAKKG